MQEVISYMRTRHTDHLDKKLFEKGKKRKVASPGIEPGSGASETLILSIVLRGQK